jgi:hypothetical protein
MSHKENDNAAIVVSKPKLERFRGNDNDTMDIKTLCLQVSRLHQVQKLGNKNTTECQLRKDVSKPSADKQRYPTNF